MSADTVHDITDILDHMGAKGMWAGSLKKEKSKVNSLGKNYEYYENNVTCVPAIFKCNDEIIANAADHCFNTRNKIKVTEIRVNIDKDGLVKVYNNGNGITIAKHHQIDKYIPEVIFSVPFAGSSNSDRKKGSLKASVNALGAKICNVHSSMFMVETADGKNCYKQVFNGIRNPSLPEIIESTENFTCISFMIDFKKFDINTSEIVEILTPWLRYRCAIVAMYTKVNVYFNDILVPIHDTKSFIEVIHKKKSLSTNVMAYGHPSWDLSICIEEKCKIKQIVIVNGVETPKGAHIDKIIGKICDSIGAIVKDEKVSKSDFMLNMIFVMSCPIINADWNEQNKDKLSIDSELIDKFTIDQKYIDNIALCLVESYMRKKDSKKNNVEQSIKYQPAKYCDSKPQLCSLMIAEGDSALAMLNQGLGLRNDIISRSYYGTFSVQGVILNIARECSTYITPDGKTMYKKSDKLRDCVRINQLRAAINLDYNKTYETEDELKTLNYRRLIICTDEDLDGVGKIAPLIMVFLYTFWPALFKNGMVFRFKTPLIRVISSSGKKMSYFTEQEFLSVHKNEKVDVRYYKGLAAHEDDDVIEMFKSENFNKSVFKLDEGDEELCRKTFNIYYGSDPELRKIEMRKDLIPCIGEQISIINETLHHDAKAYKLDAIKRQIPHIIDGLNPTRRKVVATAMIRGILSTPSSPAVKVYQFSAEVTNRMHYLHGDSINGTVIYMAQGFANHRFYPLLIRSGQFGDRHGSDAGAPRYVGVYTSPILRSLFCEEDDKSLDIVFDDGKFIEPQYYIPVVPFHILETSEAPSEGWANVTYGRDLDCVLNILKRYINGENIPMEFSEIDTKHINYLPPNMGTNKGQLKLIDEKLYSFGIYNVEETTKITKIIITELPLGILTSGYLERFQKKIIDGDKEIDNPKMRLVSKIIRLDNGPNVYIEFHITNENMEIINSKYGNNNFTSIEHFLLLYTSLGNSNLNFYSPEDKIIEFGKDYLRALLYWADYRKKAYKDRLERALIVLNTKIIMHENILRYLTDYGVNKIGECKLESDFNKIIEAKKFVKLNEGYINSNCKSGDIYSKIPDIQRLAFEEDVSYEYLVKLGSPRDLFPESIKKKSDFIGKLQIEKERVLLCLSENPPGKSLWMADIDKFKSTVEIGKRNNWLKFPKSTSIAITNDE